MTKNEKKEFCKAWLEAENIITVIDPHFKLASRFKSPEEAGPLEIKLLLQFLRIQVRALLLDRDATQRENMTLAKLIDDQQ